MGVYNNNKNYQVTSRNTVSEDAKALTIAEGASDLVISYLTNLYADPIYAMVRELFCNAADASVGEDLYVTFTINNLGIDIEDYGCGMTKEQLENNYLTYGASSKTDDFSQIGGFGLGSKTPLAVTDFFTVETETADGSAYIASVGVRDGHYAADIKDTDAVGYSHTKVSIPLKSTAEVKHALTYIKHLKAFSRVPIKIVDKTVDRLMKNSEPLNYENFYLGKVANTYDAYLYYDVDGGFESIFGRDLVKIDTYVRVGGSVIYPLNLNDTKRSNDQKARIIVDVAPGVFNFTPSRDNIIADDAFNHIYDIVLKWETEIHPFEIISLKNDEQKVYALYHLLAANKLTTSCADKLATNFFTASDIKAAASYWEDSLHGLAVGYGNYSRVSKVSKCASSDVVQHVKMAILAIKNKMLFGSMKVNDSVLEYDTHGDSEYIAQFIFVNNSPYNSESQDAKLPPSILVKDIKDRAANNSYSDICYVYTDAPVDKNNPLVIVSKLVNLVPFENGDLHSTGVEICDWSNFKVKKESTQRSGKTQRTCVNASDKTYYCNIASSGDLSSGYTESTVDNLVSVLNGKTYAMPNSSITFYDHISGFSLFCNYAGLCDNVVMYDDTTKSAKQLFASKFDLVDVSYTKDNLHTCQIAFGEKVYWATRAVVDIINAVQKIAACRYHVYDIDKLYGVVEKKTNPRLYIAKNFISLNSFKYLIMTKELKAVLSKELVLGDKFVDDILSNSFGGFDFDVSRMAKYGIHNSNGFGCVIQKDFKDEIDFDKVSKDGQHYLRAMALMDKFNDCADIREAVYLKVMNDKTLREYTPRDSSICGFTVRGTESMLSAIAQQEADNLRIINTYSKIIPVLDPSHDLDSQVLAAFKQAEESLTKACVAYIEN